MNNQLVLDKFDAEIQEVQSTLLTATNDLTNPLGDLVRSQIKRSQPPVYAAVVLTVSSQGDPTKSEAISTDDDLRHKRILLAAALEMLHIALNVHRLLVNSTRAATKENSKENGQASVVANAMPHAVTDAPSRAFIGSTILAGDYCFSRAAQMAAKTDNPQVVATFSLALQHVSEGLLREQFHTGNQAGNHRTVSPVANYDAMHLLLLSGAQAAAQLVDLSSEEEEKAINLSQEVAQYLQLHTQNIATHSGAFAQPSPVRKEANSPAWQAFYQWLHMQRANGHGISHAPQK